MGRCISRILLAVIFLATLPVADGQTTDSSPPSTPEEATQKFEKAASESDPLQQNHGMFQWAFSLNEALVRRLLDGLKTKEDRVSGLMFTVLIARLASLDPRASVDYALSTTNPGLRTVAIAAAFSSWSRSESEAAFSYISKMPKGSSRQSAVAVSVMSLVNADPDKAVSLSKKYLTEEDTAPVEPILNMAAAKDDSQKAAESALLIRERDPRNSALYMAMRKWVAKDQPAALAWAESQRTQDNRELALSAVITFWSEQDPAAAARYLIRQPESDRRNLLLGNVISELLKKDGTAATTWIPQMPPGEAKARAIESTLEWWGKKDPKAAANFALTLPPEQINYSGMWHLLSPLVKADLPTAIAFAEKLPPGEQKGWAVRHIGGYWSEKDPRQAAEFCLRNGGGENVDDAICEVAENWVRKDFSEAKSYMESLPPGQVRVMFLRSLMRIWFGTDPKAAAAYASALSEANRRGSAYFIAYDWAKVDPTAAADWSLNLPEPNTRYQGAAFVFGNWLKADPYAASVWMGKLKSGPDRNRIIYYFAYDVAYLDPANAAKWAITIDEPELRDTTLFRVMQAWVRMDATAAKEWLRKAELDQEWKNQFLR